MNTNNNELNNVYNKALSLLDFAPHTEKTLTDKLLKKGYSKEIILEVITILKENKIINDDYFAEIYAENLIKYKKTGPLKVLIKLKQKGISDKSSNIILEKVLINYGGEEEIIKQYIQKNALQIKRLFDKNEIDKIKLKLKNSGFNFQAINNVIKILPELMK